MPPVYHPPRRTQTDDSLTPRATRTASPPAKLRATRYETRDATGEVYPTSLRDRAAAQASGKMYLTPFRSLEPGQATLTLSGYLKDGTGFSASDVVAVKWPCRQTAAWKTIRRERLQGIAKSRGLARRAPRTALRRDRRRDECRKATGAGQARYLRFAGAGPREGGNSHGGLSRPPQGLPFTAAPVEPSKAPRPRRVLRRVPSTAREYAGKCTRHV